ncbi:FecR domain-containing protein [Spirosoma soli]|uniref:FecR domain-containing protein n=1 Tax=Spirosoma soli TaxID=1770529 RepID=A0ABW5M3V2_9BACT
MSQNERERHIQDYLDGKQTPEGKALFDQWADRLFQDQRFMDSLSPAQIKRFEDEMWDAISQRIGITDVPQTPQKESGAFKAVIKPEQKPRNTWFGSAARYGLAASVALLLLAGYVFWRTTGLRVDTATHGPESAVAYQEVNVPTGQRLTVTLTDGTKIYLNAESKLRYPKTLTGPTRQVFLEGEGFFEVTPNPEQPFIVTTSTLMTTVKGTSFDVNAYPGESVAEVTVMTGKVDVVTRHGKHQLLRPGQRVTHQPDLDSLTSSTVADPTQAIAWRDGTLTFRRTPMSDIVQQLQRQYGVRIRLTNPQLKSCTVVGEFSHATLDNVLEVLCSSISATYQINRKEVLIRGNGCP